jgi:methyl-accepting chemotaxis protein
MQGSVMQLHSANDQWTACVNMPFPRLQKYDSLHCLIANLVSILLDSPITQLEELIENHTNTEDNATSLNMTLEKIEEAMKTIGNKLDTIKTSFEAIKNLQDNPTNSTTIDNQLDKIHQEVTNLSMQVKQISQQGNYRAALLTGL